MEKQTMSIQYTPLDQLPSLAWVASTMAEDKGLTVIHGKLVETRPQYFFEGVWSGSIEAQEFARNSLIFGSGCVITEKRITFVTPSSTTDYLYWCDSNGNLTVSNSLPLLLALCNDRLDPSFSTYPKINQSITLGIRKYEKKIPTKNGVVNRLIHANLVVEQGRVKEEEKSPPKQFACFREYESYLKENYGRIAKNARHPCRVRPLQIYSTQSRGYDTTAVNAIAKDFGVDKVFTITTSRGGAFGDEDGSEICASLGLSCDPINRLQLESGFPEEYLFYASLHINMDANLLGAIRKMSSPSLLLTGILGEIWYPRYNTRPGTVNDELIRWSLPGHGLTEIRLDAGFVQVAIPFIGARSREDILRITESDQMQPWRLGTSYDKPIPRRIAETAGVPRDLFGQIKMGTSILSPRPYMPVNDLLHEEFIEFLVDQCLLKRWQVNLIPFVRKANQWIAHRNQHKSIYYIERLIAKVSGLKLRIPLFWHKLEGSLYCYCVNKRIHEYNEALRDDKKPSN